MELRGNMSARELSINLGLNENYINQIELGKSMPSLEVVGYICDYFQITIFDFFDIDNQYPLKTKELLEVTKSLNRDEMDSIINMIRQFKKNLR